MLSLLLVVFVFVAGTLILALAVIGAIIFRKKSSPSSSRVDPTNVIDVTAKNEQ